MRIFIILILLSLQAFSSIGNVAAIKGTAKLSRDTMTLNIIAGMSIEVADKILTDKKSKIQVILKDDTIITIGQSTSFSFDEYLYDGSEKSKVEMKISHGFFRSVTGHIGEVAPERFKVKTTSATIGIRGTDFSVKSDIQGNERITCYSGKIFISRNNEGLLIRAGQTQEKKQNKKAVIKNNKKAKRKNPVSDTAIDLQDVGDILLQDEIRIIETPEIPIVDTYIDIDSGQNNARKEVY